MYAVLGAVPMGVGLLRGAKRDLTRSAQTELELPSEVARRVERARIAREIARRVGAPARGT